MEQDSSIPAEVSSIFYRANFVRDLGMKLTGLGPGWCETTLAVQERFRQQHGFVHGGVIASMADHTAGGAAYTAAGGGDVLTLEFKINYLVPAKGDFARCLATVVRAGRRTIVSEASVYMKNSGEQEKEELVAKLTETLLVIRPGK